MKKSLEMILAVGVSVLIGCTPAKKDAINYTEQESTQDDLTSEPRLISPDEFFNKYGTLADVTCSPTGEIEVLTGFYNDGTSIYLVSQPLECIPNTNTKNQLYINKMDLIFVLHREAKRIDDRIFFNENLEAEKFPYGIIFSLNNGDFYFAVDIERDDKIDMIYYLESGKEYPAPLNLEPKKPAGIF